MVGAGGSPDWAKVRTKIAAGDNADKCAVPHHRKALDAMHCQGLSDLGERSIVPNSHYMPGH